MLIQNPPTIDQRLQARDQPSGLIPVMYQTWRDLLFIHWIVDPEEVRRNIPEGLFVDTYNGKCFVAAIPFILNNLHLPLLPPFPFISNFYETNVRTYVFNEDGTPGIWFYSLYANHTLAVKAARYIPLPYELADISVNRNNDFINYKLNKIKKSPSEEYEFIYNPAGEIFYPVYDSLEFFLIERYFLFFLDRGKKLKKIRVHHQPYPLQLLNLKKHDSSLLNLNNINPISKEPAHFIFSPGPGEVKIYFPEKNQD